MLLAVCDVYEPTTMLLVFILSAQLRVIYAFNVQAQPCDGLVSTATNLSDISVDKVVLGEDMNITYRLNSEVSLTRPQIVFQLETSGFPIPCNPETAFGSCTYSLCGRERFDAESGMCSSWNCTCPVQPGSYVVSLMFPMPRFSGILGAIITSQDTKVEARLVDNGKTAFCGTFALRAKEGADGSGNDGLFGLLGRRSCWRGHGVKHAPRLQATENDSDVLNNK